MSKPVAIIDDGDEHVLLITGTENMEIGTRTFNTIREGIVFYEGLVLTPEAVENYCQEVNPRLIGAEVTIEKDRIRRKNQNKFEDLMKYVVPIAILFIAGAIAYKMISGGDVQGAATAIQSANPLALK